MTNEAFAHERFLGGVLFPGGQIRPASRGIGAKGDGVTSPAGQANIEREETCWRSLIADTRAAEMARVVRTDGTMVPADAPLHDGEHAKN